MCVCLLYMHWNTKNLHPHVLDDELIDAATLLRILT